MTLNFLTLTFPHTVYICTTRQLSHTSVCREMDSKWCDSILRAWCKTIVTSYIKWGSYNSFAPCPRFHFHIPWLYANVQNKIWQIKYKKPRNTFASTVEKYLVPVLMQPCFKSSNGFSLRVHYFSAIARWAIQI